MSGKIRRWLMLVVCLLSLMSVAAVSAELGPDEGTIRGAAFLDNNRNGQLDPGEEGVGWVYFTISNGDYTHTYHTEWQTVDSAGNTYATGHFGPVPLHKGGWTVTFSVPEGYQATTPVKQTINVPGAEGGHVAYAYLGLYPGKGSASSVLPVSGLTNDTIVIGALVLLGVGGLLAVGLGLSARRKS